MIWSFSDQFPPKCDRRSDHDHIWLPKCDLSSVHDRDLIVIWREKVQFHPSFAIYIYLEILLLVLIFWISSLKGRNAGTNKLLLLEAPENPAKFCNFSSEPKLSKPSERFLGGGIWGGDEVLAKYITVSSDLQQKNNNNKLLMKCYKEKLVKVKFWILF